jgi:uncharacterized protein (TIGR02996 family)
MDTEAAFLAAIRAAPADDAARMVYADWLQEQGEDARAELIRVQIELSHGLPPQPATLTYDLTSSAEHIERVLAFKASQAKRAELERRERELMKGVRLPLPPGWAVGVGLGMFARGARGDLYLRRGLGERAACTGGAWVADGDAVMAFHPIERVRLTTTPTTFTVAAEIGLANDPRQRTYDRELVRAARRATDIPLGSAGALLSLLRLRFGTEIAFELTANDRG